MTDNNEHMIQNNDSQRIQEIEVILERKVDITDVGMIGLKKALVEKNKAIAEFARIVLNTRLDKHQIDFANTVSTFRIIEWNDDIKNALLLCLNNPSIDPQSLVAVSLSLLRLRPYSPDDPLLLALMGMILPDTTLEHFLLNMRKELLLHLDDIQFLEPFRLFIYALSCQCALNEYIYAVTPFEESLVEKLLNSLMSELQVLDPKTTLLIALLSCYRPLYSTPLPQLLSSHLPFQGDPAFLDILKRQMFDSIREKELAKNMPTLGTIDNEISKKVRGQYEDHPYPRWNKMEGVKPVAFQSLMQSLFPWSENHPSNSKAPLQVLVAGCGTGKHAIHCAATYANSQVIAVDLSLSSLAYAKRMAEELGIANVTFIHGDILDLKRLNIKFDVVECIGVLHHMQDPVKGWKILTALLKDEGWMNIGLYSQIARKKIAEAREYVIKNHYQGTIEEIRKCRTDIMNKPEGEAIKSVVMWQDFYTTSTCRDLLFHVHEVHFNLIQIEEILIKLGLHFVGFNIPTSIKLAYKKMFPEDSRMISLRNWHEFEVANPETFLTMYQFWGYRR